VANLVRRGAERILVVPFFLTLGIHLRRDLPRIVEELSRIHNGMAIEVAPPMEGHAALRHVLLDRIKAGGMG
jgi:sirohydrochlorin ferrochelatase